MAIMGDAEIERLNELFAEWSVYDRQGRRIDYTEYRRLRADLDYRFVARDDVGDAEVVTAWLGLDQGSGDELWIFGTSSSRRPPATYAERPHTEDSAGPLLAQCLGPAGLDRRGANP